MFRLSLTILAAIVINLVALLEPRQATEVAEPMQALSRTAQVESRWMLTRILHGKDGMTEEHYQAWAPEGERWRLVWQDGREPERGALVAYGASQPRDIQLQQLLELVRHKDTLVEENDLYQVHHFRFSTKEAEQLGGKGPLFGAISVRKTSGLVESVVLQTANHAAVQGQG